MRVDPKTQGAPGRPTRWQAACLAVLAGIGLPAWADPGYYVVTAYDEPGARSVELRYWTVDKPHAPAVTWPEAGLRWNPTGRWSTGLLVSYIGLPERATRLSSLNWQNDVLLTGGQYPFDLALHTLLVRPQHPAAGHLFEFGPVLQTDVGRTQLNLNLFFERGFGAQDTRPTQLKYQWQVRHRWMPALHLGLQGFGEVGAWDHWPGWHAQSHRAGPALFGTLRSGNSAEQGKLSWQAALLSGKTYAQRCTMLSLRAAYEF